MKTLTPQQISRLKNMFATAQQALRSGLTSQAEGLFRDILKQAPEAWDVHQQLALLFARSGRTDEAVKHFRLIVKANPAYAPGHANLANALAESGQLDEAIAEFRRSVTIDPTLIGARIALGETLRRASRPDEAAAVFKTVLDQDRVNHAAFNGLGLVYRDLEDLPRALECFEHATGIAPQSAEYRMNFGAALEKYKLQDLAAEQYYEATKLMPESLDAIVLLGKVLQELRRYDDAKECFDRALMLKPVEPELHERLGFVYLDMGDAEHAIDEFHGVLEKHPERYMGMLGLGRGHMEAGHSEQAAATFETLVNKYPEEGSGYFYLALSRKFKENDPIIPQLKAVAEKSNKDKRSETALNFALGKIHDDCKQWDSAFHYYAAGNRLRNQQSDYKPEEDEAYYDSLMSVFTADFMQEYQECGGTSNLPVIIVGMPRSGTTLTEQIVSSHPKIIGAGEVVFWYYARTSMPLLLESDAAYPDCMRQITPKKASTLADRYIGLLRKIAGPNTNPAHITDKMPHNFVNLGLIALLFPNAPIIHCKRDAMDNCLSIFFQNFGAGHPYAYDLTNIGHHYRLYERLMAHWHQVLPGRILDINYEDTIADPEYWSRKLIAHVGLEWDDACLAPHKLERTVKTASQWQVRQPIYKTSVARWRHYENYLEPLKEALSYEEKPDER